MLNKNLLFYIYFKACNINDIKTICSLEKQIGAKIKQ